MSNSEASASFLTLPVELRIQIYNCFIPCGSYTISSVATDQSCYTLNEADSIPGLPLNHKITAKHGYDPALVTNQQEDWSLTVRPTTPNADELLTIMRIMHDLPDGHSDVAQGLWARHLYSRRFSQLAHDPSSSKKEHKSLDRLESLDEKHLNEIPASLYYTQAALRLTCKTIHSDLCEHFPHKSNPAKRTSKQEVQGIDLYLSYPAGVCIVAHQFAHLLKSVGTLTITGMCEVRGNGGWGKDEAMIKQQTKALEVIVAGLLGKSAVQQQKQSFKDQRPIDTRECEQPNTSQRYPKVSFPTLRLRVFHPQTHAGVVDTSVSVRRQHYPDPYALMWQDDYSPTAAALRSIYGGRIDLLTVRSRGGAGAEIVARGNGGPEREISSRHRTVGQLGGNWTALEWLGSEWPLKDDNGS